MDEYDDSDEYSAANSFRARSNTWPMNRPEATLSNQVNIDEPLPEIQLEDDDLFTTNEHWNTGHDFEDHDIMSWDPILNAQNMSPVSNALHLQNQLQLHQQRHHLLYQQHHQADLRQEQNDICNSEALLSGSSRLLSGETLHQQDQQPPPLNHQTLNSSSCFQSSDLSDDPNEYHVRQLHQLRLGSQPQSAHQHHYMSNMCLPNSSDVVDGYSLPEEHHQLQQLSSAPYDLEASELDTNEAHLNTNTLDNDHLQLRPVLDRNQEHHPSQLLSSLNHPEIGLRANLEADLEYKSVDPSAVLNIQPVDGCKQQNDKTSNLSSSSKNKLNTPRRNAWGNMSYADLISQAINSTNDKRLTLSQIYDWMVQNVPYFKDKGDSNSSAGWKNSVRHNLSLHNRFKRIQNEGTGKSSWWTINPEANIGKCARRRAASMEASKYEKKRRGAKKRADAIRSGLVSYDPLTKSSLVSSYSLEQSLNQITRGNTSGSGGSIKNSITFNKNITCAENRQQATAQASLPQQQVQQQQQLQQQQQQQQSLKYEIDQSQTQSHSPTTTSPLHQQQTPVQKMQQQAPLSQHQQPTQDQNIQSQQQQAPQQQPQQNHQQRPSPELLQPLIQSITHQQQQTQQIQTKLQTHEASNYFMQAHHIHQHPQQMLNQTDHVDLFGRHAIYISEPCNDCTCADQRINCSNALSLI